ncbi:MAG: hypothetical protein SFW09_03225 [Hyphomicrobiaceae bacterium]|nr:hypothetical protein [Hyphomicrobiaceae bacterium]
MKLLRLLAVAEIISVVALTVPSPWIRSTSVRPLDIAQRAKNLRLHSAFAERCAGTRDAVHIQNVRIVELALRSVDGSAFAKGIDAAAARLATLDFRPGSADCRAGQRSFEEDAAHLAALAEMLRQPS